MASKAIFGCVIFILSLAFYSSAGAANWNPLPDTGQTTCYDADGNEITCPAEGESFYGQDANYQGPAPSFTDNGDGTVTDNNTGLIWQKSNWYSTYTERGIATTWSGAINYCSNLELGGLSNWRLPELIELDSILKTAVDVGLGFFEPFLEYWDPDSAYWDPYWTATSYAYNTDAAWAILVYKRSDTYTLKTNPETTHIAHVRCVHDPSN